MVEVDARGFSCPIPVVKTQKAISQNPGTKLTVLVDTGTAKENVSRMAKSKGYSVKQEKADDGYCLVLDPPGG